LGHLLCAGEKHEIEFPVSLKSAAPLPALDSLTFIPLQLNTLCLLDIAQAEHIAGQRTQS